MKRLFQTATLFGALFLGQQAFAQDSVNTSIQAPATPTKDSKQELSQSIRQKNPFRIKRFSIENFVQGISYQDCRNQGLNYQSRNNPEQSSELEDFVFENSLLKKVYEISKDNKPFQLYDNRVTFTISSRPNFPRQNFSQGNAFRGNQSYVTRKKNSPIYGFLRWLIKPGKK